MSSAAKVTRSVGITVLVLAGLGVSSGAAQNIHDAGPKAPILPAVGGVSRFDFGIGAGSLGGGQAGFALRGAFTFSKFGDRAALLTVRGALVEEHELFGPSPAENVWDVGVLYGRQVRGRWAYASAAAGLALVGGMRRGERISPPIDCSGYDPLGGLFCALGAAFTTVKYAENPFHTVGIPVEVEAGFTFSSRVGLGVSAFANLNGQRTLTGASFSVVLGKLR